MWFLAESNEYKKPPLGAIIMNAIFGLLMTVFFTYLTWFGVMKKGGCCCFILCCCLGKPNLLAVAILCVIYGVLAILAVVQGLGSAQGALILVAVLVAAFFALLHGVALLYVGFEAFMIWRLSTSESPATQDSIAANKSKAVVGNTMEVVGASADGASDLEKKMESPASEVQHQSEEPIVDLETGKKTEV